MAPEKVTDMVLNVDLKCSGCYKKVKKVICKIPQITDQVFDVDKNKVKIKVVCCSPEKIRDKLCYKGEGAIQSIEIIEKPPEQTDKPNVPEEAKPVGDKPKPVGDRPKIPKKVTLVEFMPEELEKAKPAADKPKDHEKAKPAADKPKEPEKVMPAADKPKELEKAKLAADKPKEPEKSKPPTDKPKEPEKAMPATDKSKEPGKPKESEKAKPADKPKEPEKSKPADKSKVFQEPEKAKPKDPEKLKEANKPNPPKDELIKLDAGPNPDAAKMVYEPVHGYPQMHPLSAYPMVGYGWYNDNYYGGVSLQHGYGTPVAPPPPPGYGGFGYGYEHNGYNGSKGQYAINDYEDEDDGGCSIM